jgi:catechol 2,3-dioxygenase-like lactoylglutathione lyase family enzyme
MRAATLVLLPLVLLVSGTLNRRSDMPAAPLVSRITPVIYVPRVEPCLPFWTERLGFTKVAEVPGPDGRPQFALLVRDGVEVMYQTWAALEAESPAAAAGQRGHSIALFIEVSDIDGIDRMLSGVPRVVERHKTFYGMDEFSVREPGGALVTFAMRVAEN